MGLLVKAGVAVSPVAVAAVPVVLAVIVLWRRFREPIPRALADTEAQEPTDRPR